MSGNPPSWPIANIRALLAGLDSVCAGVVVRDRHGGLVYANRAAVEIVGGWGPGGSLPSVEEVARRSVREDGSLLTADELPMGVVLRTGRPVQGFVMGMQKPGAASHRWLLANAEPVREPDSQEVRDVVITFVDITERRAAEEQLRYRLAFESLISRISTELVDVDGDNVDAAIFRTLRAVGEFCSVDRAYVFQARPDGRTVDNTHEWCAPGIESHIQHWQNIVPERQFPWVNRRLRDLEVVHLPSLTMLPEEAGLERQALARLGLRSLLLVPMARRGQAVGFLGFDAAREEKSWSEDSITLLRLVGEIIGGVLERQRALQVLRESEECLRTLFQNLSDVVLVIDSRGRLRFETPSLQCLLGLSPDHLGEVSVEQLVCPEDLDELRALLQEVVTGRPSQRRELRWRRADGSLVPCEVVAANLLDRPAIRGILLTLRDVSERRAAEEERRRLEQQLQQTQRLESLGILAGGVAHDFNNLLTGILGDASLAMSALPAGSAAFESLRRLEQTARRAAELTQELLAYSGQGRLSKERVQLSVVVEEMARLLHATVSRTATLECCFAPDAPWVEADVAQLRQVIMNLILNAAEACAQRGTVRLSIGKAPMERAELAGLLLGSSLPAGEYAWLEVRDDGVGMHPDVVARIFDPFFTTKFTGRGLGLAAVLGIVRGHGGALEVESQPGEGTRFRVVLPTCQPPRLLPVSATSSAPVAAGELPNVPRTVLIVDDDNTVRILAQTILQRAGYPTLAAVDGLPALELFAQHADEIGLVLLDMTMPRMSGEDVLRTLRALRPDLPVVVSSGYHESEAAEQFGLLAPGSFLQKPYDSARLLGAVSEALRRASRTAAAGAEPARARP